MSGIRLVESDSDLTPRGQTVTDLVRDLKSRFQDCLTLSDLETHMKRLAQILKHGDLGSDQKRELLSLRQKGYDRRAKLRKKAPDPQISDPEKSGLFKERRSDPFRSSEVRSDPQILDGARSEKSDLSRPQTREPACKTNPNPNEESQMRTTCDTLKAPRKQTTIEKLTVWEGIVCAARSIDGEKIARRLPSLLVLFSFTSLVGALLWHQSIDLYRSSQFADPWLIALGSIFMVVGFAVYYSIHRSKLALLCCLYVGCYEVYFVISGTLTDEVATNREQLSKVSNQVWLEDQLLRTKSEYHKYKARYENPAGKNYENVWYKKNYVDPAWKKYSDSQRALEKALARLQAASQIDHTSLLKIFYRLGLVLLLMVLVHQVSGILRSPR